LKTSFCDRCGDFFACSDSLEWYRKSPPPKSLDVLLEKAEEVPGDGECPGLGAHEELKSISQSPVRRSESFT
jgi:hypothetical protein